MNKRIKVRDRYGRELEDEDEDGKIVIPDGGHITVALPFMDGRSNTYGLRDGAGRPAGVASVEGALKVQDALERSCMRYKRKPRQVRDGKPNPWRFYTDWLIAHGNL